MKTTFNEEELSLNIANIIVVPLPHCISGKQRAMPNAWLATSDKNKEIYLRICKSLEEGKDYTLFSTEYS